MPSVLVANSVIEEERGIYFALARRIAICQARKKVGGRQRHAEGPKSQMRLSQSVEPRTARLARLPGHRFAAGTLRSLQISHRVGTVRRHRPAARPNTSVKATRYGMRRKPGLRQSQHGRSPGLRRMPPRAPYLER
jgi:hypothetical protein